MMNGGVDGVVMMQEVQQHCVIQEMRGVVLGNKIL